MMIVRMGRHYDRSMSALMCTSFVQFVKIWMVLILKAGVTTGTIQEMDLSLPATDQFVMYMVSYVRGPGGSIDLSQLTFEPDDWGMYSDDYSGADLYGTDDSYEDDYFPGSSPTSSNPGTETVAPTVKGSSSVSGGGAGSVDPASSANPDAAASTASPTVTANPGRVASTASPTVTTNPDAAASTASPTVTANPDRAATTSSPTSTSSNNAGTPSGSGVPGDTSTAAPSGRAGSGSSASPGPTPTRRKLSGRLLAEQELLPRSLWGHHASDEETHSPSVAPTPVPVHDTYVDIAVFQLPDDCVRDPNDSTQCDYAALGVGRRDPDSQSLRWCCNFDSVKLNLCNATSDDDPAFGRLLFDDNIYEGFRASMVIPSTGTMLNNSAGKDYSTHLPADQARMPDLDTANYVVMYSNCNTRFGRSVHISGESIFSSRHGYLPGQLYGFMYFYVLLTGAYATLFIWYNVLMFLYRQHRITIEEYIRLAITLGFIEVVFCVADYFHWNNVGYRSTAILWLGLMFGVLKQGISRCLMVMVALGWGVVTDSLSRPVIIAIAVLGVLYTVAAATINAMVFYAMESYYKLSYDATEDIFNVVSALNQFKVVVDTIFMIWILAALILTMRHLKAQNQMRKLQRTRRLFTIACISIAFALLFALIAYADNHSSSTNAVAKQRRSWMKTAATETNYLFVLIAIALLWQPNKNARQFAYVMELNTSDDADYDENGNFKHDLELTPSANSSARDEHNDDDDFDDNPFRSKREIT